MNEYRSAFDTSKGTRLRSLPAPVNARSGAEPGASFRSPRTITRASGSLSSMSSTSPATNRACSIRRGSVAASPPRFDLKWFTITIRGNSPSIFISTIMGGREKSERAVPTEETPPSPLWSRSTTGTRSDRTSMPTSIPRRSGPSKRNALYLNGRSSGCADRSCSADRCSTS